MKNITHIIYIVMHFYEKNYLSHTFKKPHRATKKKYFVEERWFIHFVRINNLTSSLIGLVKFGPQTL